MAERDGCQNAHASLIPSGSILLNHVALRQNLPLPYPASNGRMLSDSVSKRNLSERTYLRVWSSYG